MPEAVSGMGEDIQSYIPPGTKARRSLSLRQKDVPKPRNRQCIGPMPASLTESLAVFFSTLTKTHQCFVVCPAKLQERNTFSTKQLSFSFFGTVHARPKKQIFQSTLDSHLAGSVKVGEVPFENCVGAFSH